jgi:hypothetical protein
MMRVQVLRVKQRHGQTEAERTSNRRSVTVESKNVSDTEQDPESESLRLLHGDGVWGVTEQ